MPEYLNKAMINLNWIALAEFEVAVKILRCHSKLRKGPDSTTPKANTPRGRTLLKSGCKKPQNYQKHFYYPDYVHVATLFRPLMIPDTIWFFSILLLVYKLYPYFMIAGTNTILADKLVILDFARPLTRLRVLLV